MRDLCILTKKEKLELESIVEILLSVHLDFESATNPDEDNDDLCQNVEEVRERMEYDMRYLEKAETVCAKFYFVKNLMNLFLCVILNYLNKIKNSIENYVKYYKH